MSGSLNLTAKVGDKVKIPTYQVSDNVDSVDKLTTYVQIYDAVSGRMYLYEKDEFTAKDKGVYKISIMCMDSRGNTAMVMVTVEVK